MFRQACGSLVIILSLCEARSCAKLIYDAVACQRLCRTGKMVGVVGKGGGDMDL